MQHIRLGVIGVGRRGEYLLGLAADSFDGVTPVAMCDVNLQNPQLRRAAEKYPDAKLFTDVEAMLDQAGPDAVLIETPARLHARFAAAALERGIHVMSDVPAVESMANARLLWEADQRADALYMIGANPNLWAFVDAAVAFRDEGKLGDPYCMEAEYIHDCRALFEGTPWRRTFEPILYCTHSLGPLLRLIDEDLSVVSCFDTGSHVRGNDDEHDLMTALFRTPSNVVVRLTCSFINNYPGGNHRYRVYGTKGYFERTPRCDSQNTVRTLVASTELPDPEQLVELPVGEMRPELAERAEAQGHGGADYSLLDRFFGAIRGEGDSPINLREALRMTLPGIAAAESARRGGELVPIEYPWT